VHAGAAAAAGSTAITSPQRKEDPMVTKKEQILFDFLAQVSQGATDPKRRAMLRECSEQIQRILAASIRAEKKEKDFRRKDRHSQTGSEGRAEPRLELEPKQKLN
jgi:hypothetical protein